MSIFYRGQYNINLDNIRHIDAIAKYNKNVSATEITCDNGFRIDGGQLLKSLREIVNLAKQNGASRITVKYDSANSDALRDIFPKIRSNNFNFKINAIGEFVAQRLKIISDLALKDMVLNFEKRLFEKELHEQEALDIVKMINKKLNILNAAHLNEEKVIIFEHQSFCYALKYGQGSDLIQLESFHFDIDDGFFSKYELDSDSLTYKVITRLQTYFNKWKNIDYQGDLVPETSSLENLCLLELEKFPPDPTALLNLPERLLEEIKLPEEIRNKIVLKKIDKDIIDVLKLKFGNIYSVESKAEYIKLLKTAIENSNMPNVKQEMANYLMAPEQAKHLLKKERDFFRFHDYSSETRSMHEVLDWLTNSNASTTYSLKRHKS